jgi:hypothetical protein
MSTTPKRISISSGGGSNNNLKRISSNSINNSILENVVICEGWLKKEEGTLIKRWTTKYFQLCGPNLIQFAEHPSKCKTYETFYDLSEKKNVNIEIVEREERKQEYFFKVQIKSTTTFFSCETHISCTEWVVSLKNIITKKDENPWKRVVNSKFSAEKSDKEADMEKLLKIVQSKTNDENLRNGASYLFKWYQEISKKLQKNQAEYQEYMYRLHQRIKQVENSGMEFSESQGDKEDRTCHLLLEFLNVYQKKKLQKLEAKEAYIRFQFIKLCKTKPNIPKLAQYKIQLKENFIKDIYDLDKEVKELKDQIDGLSKDLRERFTKFTEKLISEENLEKEKLMKQQASHSKTLMKLPTELETEEMVIIENESEKNLVELEIQIVMKQLSKCSLRIDNLENFFTLRELEVKFLYFKEKEMRELWEHIFQEDRMIHGIDTLIKHLKAKQIKATHENIKTYLTYLEDLFSDCAKNIEDYSNISNGLMIELEGLKTHSFKIQYHYILFAQTKLKLMRKQIQLEKFKIDMITARMSKIVDLEKLFQPFVGSSDFNNVIPECEFILKDYQSLHKEFIDKVFNKNEELIKTEREIEEIKLELATVKTIMSGSVITKTGKNHSSLYDILLDNQTFERKYLNNFISQCKPDEEKEDFYYLKNAKLFIVDLSDIIEENRPELKLEKNEIYATIEKILFSQIYDEFFLIFQDTENDEKFINNCEKLSETLILDLLPITEASKFENDYGDGIHILSQLSEHRTPSSKLISIYCASKRILEILETQTATGSTICGGISNFSLKFHR